MDTIFSRFIWRLKMKDYKYKKLYKIGVVEKDFNLWIIY